MGSNGTVPVERDANPMREGRTGREPGGGYRGDTAGKPPHKYQ